MIYTELRAELCESAAEVEAECLATRFTEEQIRETLSNDAYVYMVAEDGGIAVGTASACFAADCAQLINLAVRREYRRRGAAIGLLSAVCLALRERGCEEISLEVASLNAAAIGLYEKAGFKKAGLRRRFYKEPEDDAVIMTKSLNEGKL